MLVIAATWLSGCAHTVSPCDGWQPQRPKGSTVDYLYANDPAFADSVLAHNLHGQQVCGWVAR